jgi:stage V sporulation protein G
MEISDVRVRLVKDANDRLKAVCSVTLDGEFVVRDVKVVEGTNGLFVAMPSRKLSVPCPKCRTQNHLRAKHCNECGARVPAARVPSTDDGREKAHRDIAHPITAAFRQTLQGRVLDAYQHAFEDEMDEDGDFDVTDETPREGHAGAGESEYGALIADLKGRGNERQTGDHDRDREPRRRRRGRRGPRREQGAGAGGQDERGAEVAAPRAGNEDSGMPGSRDSDTFGVFTNAGRRERSGDEADEPQSELGAEQVAVSSVPRDEPVQHNTDGASESDVRRPADDAGEHQDAGTDEDDLGFGAGIL